MTRDEIKKGPIYLNIDSMGIDVVLTYELQSGKVMVKFIPIIGYGVPQNMSEPKGNKNFMEAVNEALDAMIDGVDNSLSENPGLENIKRVVSVTYNPKARKYGTGVNKTSIRANPYYLIIGEENDQK
jgi:hypothetical protein